MKIRFLLPSLLLALAIVSVPALAENAPDHALADWSPLPGNPTNPCELRCTNEDEARRRECTDTFPNEEDPLRKTCLFEAFFVLLDCWARCEPITPALLQAPSGEVVAPRTGPPSEDHERDMRDRDALRWEQVRLLDLS